MKYFLPALYLLFVFSAYSQNGTEISQIEKVDFKKAAAQLRILPEKMKVEGKVSYVFDVLQEADSIYIDARNMKFEELELNGKPVEYTNTGSRLWLRSDFKISENNNLSLKYEVSPSQTMYFVNWDLPENIEANRQVWTQGQGKYTSYWLPSFDDMKEKLEFDLSFDFKKGYQLVANGVLQEKLQLNDSITRWEFDMQKPMSSYLVAVATGDFMSDKFVGDSGVPVQLYYLPQDSAKAEPTYRYSDRIFSFIEKEIGVDYPWQNYKQIPVQDFLYAGMENTGTTIFANSLMTDSIGFKDRNYVNVNAHELAHQWFGNLVTETESKHHWLHEGFATYYALLAEREIFGDDYYYWKLYETAEQLKELSDDGKGEALLNPNASSLTFYQKGAWALHMLREKVGDEAFRAAVKSYLEKYKFSNVVTEDFLAEVEKTSGQDLSGFRKNWLEQSAFKANAALNSLKNSEFIKSLLEIAALREVPFSQKSEKLSEALDFPVNDYIGQEVVIQLAGEDSPETIGLYKKAFDSNNIFVRQVIAMSMDQIPLSLKSEYESLLEDESYLTKEAALFSLWMQFPEDQGRYLEKTKGIEGFYNKNVRMLWLALNLATPSYQSNKKQQVYKELSGYTATRFPVEMRENAFGYLYQLDAFSEQNLLDLLEGTQHFNRKFRNFSRELLEELLKSQEYQEKYVALSKALPESQQNYLNQKLSN
ncbi:M1 family metallopeptidase [Salegentibacter chungangensis]|uniref:Aminopeptidase N n=1 Tax=Salegentibacter chungangensis TaxID=1335724 RepID=A0ABW3NR51_9FLAO